MTEPRVSVVVPARDNAAYIGETLESLLGQTLPPAEVIVVDDGSTDATAEIAISCGDPVRVVSQPPEGLATALNRGIAEAAEALIAFCDADDICTLDRLERQVAILAHDPTCAVVSGFVQQFASPDVVELTRGLRIDTRPTAAALNGTLMVRAEVFDSVGRFDTSYLTSTGVDWMARVRSQGVRVCMVQDVVLLRRVHDKNLGVVARDQKRQDLTRLLREHNQRRRDADHEAST